MQLNPALAVLGFHEAGFPLSLNDGALTVSRVALMIEM